MSELYILNDMELENVAGGGVKPSDVGSPVDQYAVRPGCSYYLHYCAGGNDEWLKVDVLEVFEQEVGHLPFGIKTFTKRSAKVRVQLTGMVTSLPINQPGCICSIAA